MGAGQQAAAAVAPPAQSATSPSIQNNANNINYGVGYNEEQAKKLWTLSKVAYCQQQDVTNWSCNQKVDSSKCPINRYDFNLDKQMIRTTGSEKLQNFGFIAGSPEDNTIYIVFRGTSNKQNWMTNFNVFQTKKDTNFLYPSHVATTFPNLSQKKQVAMNAATPQEQILLNKGETFQGNPQVHEGYLKSLLDQIDVISAAKQFLEDIAKQIKAKSQKVVQIYVTGHSQGAGLATLAMQFVNKLCQTLKDQSQNQLCQLAPQQYVFCSPRVGNSDWVQVFNSELKANNVQLWRVVRGNDPVVTSPFLIQDYNHVGKMAWYKEENQPPIFCDEYQAKLGSVQSRGNGEYDPACNIHVGVLNMNISHHSQLFGFRDSCSPDSLNYNQMRYQIMYRKELMKARRMFLAKRKALNYI